jgi:hypothetical protein
VCVVGQSNLLREYKAALRYSSFASILFASAFPLAGITGQGSGNWLGDSAENDAFPHQNMDYDCYYVSPKHVQAFTKHLVAFVLYLYTFYVKLAAQSHYLSMLYLTVFAAHHFLLCSVKSLTKPTVSFSNMIFGWYQRLCQEFSSSCCCMNHQVQRAD